jgi:hypothetical protein
MTDPSKDMVDAIMKRMGKASKRRAQSSDSVRRRQAANQVLRGEDFMDVAAEHKISPRVLLAWIEHIQGAWVNDPTEGREPGPSADYQGEWPSEQVELERYAQYKVDPDRLNDVRLRARYQDYLLKRTSPNGP